MPEPVLVLVSPELVETMLTDAGMPLRRLTRVRVKPLAADDWERLHYGATYSMVFTEERDDD